MTCSTLQGKVPSDLSASNGGDQGPSINGRFDAQACIIYNPEYSTRVNSLPHHVSSHFDSSRR